MAPGLWASEWAPEDMEAPKVKITTRPPVPEVAPPKPIYHLDWLLSTRPKAPTTFIDVDSDEHSNTPLAQIDSDKQSTPLEAQVDSKEQLADPLPQQSEVVQDDSNLREELNNAVLVLNLLIKAKKDDTLLVESLKLVEATVDKALGSCETPDAESVTSEELNSALLVLSLLIKAKKDDSLLVESLKLVEIAIDNVRVGVNVVVERHQNPKNSLDSLTISPLESDFQGPKERNLNIPKDERVPDAKFFECEICKTGKVYKSQSKLVHHLETKHFYCQKCDLTYITREELIKHLAIKKEHHNFCKLCLLDFESLEALTRHLDKEHKPPTEPIACPGCGLKCDEAFEVIRHLENDLCPSIPLLDFNRARTITALIQRHSLGPYKNLPVAEQIAVKEQSLKLLRGDEFIVAGLPLVNKSAWSPFFNSAAHAKKASAEKGSAGIAWKCPYSGCGKLFNEVIDFFDHLRAGHFTYGICPGCFKGFESIHGLFQHLTKAEGNCKVSKRSTFPYAIAAVSGGYIKAERKTSPGNWNLAAGAAPCAELYVYLPQVTGKK